MKIDGPAAKMKKRFVGATEIEVCLCDVSGSMANTIGSLGVTKWEECRIALQDALITRPNLRIIAFGSGAKEIRDPGELPSPLGEMSGRTDLRAALLLAAELRPRRTFIISDGLPDSTTLATEAAQNLTGRIDTIYCGPEGHAGADYLHSLARVGGGRGVNWEGRTQLTEILRPLLCAPAE